MVSLVLGQNEFSGTIPDNLFEAQLVTNLDISSNRCVPAARAACSSTR